MRSTSTFLSSSPLRTKSRGHKSVLSGPADAHGDSFSCGFLTAPLRLPLPHTGQPPAAPQPPFHPVLCTCRWSPVALPGPLMWRIGNGSRWPSPFHMSHFWSREMQKHHLSLTNPGGAGPFTPEAGLPRPRSNSRAWLSSSLISWQKRGQFPPPALGGGKAPPQSAEPRSK